MVMHIKKIISTSDYNAAWEKKTTQINTADAVWCISDWNDFVFSFFWFFIWEFEKGIQMALYINRAVNISICQWGFDFDIKTFQFMEWKIMHKISYFQLSFFCCLLVDPTEAYILIKVLKKKIFIFFFFGWKTETLSLYAFIWHFRL